MLTTFDTKTGRSTAGRAGSSSKRTRRNRARRGVRLAAGGALIDPLTTRRLIGRFTSAVRPAREVPSVLSALTGRELDVFRLVAEGLSNAEIAERLVVEESTIKTHIGHILAKLTLRDPSASGGPGLRDRVRPG